MPPFVTRLGYGVTKGLKLALGLSLLVATIVALSGKGGGDAMSPPLVVFVGAYFAVGLVGGALYGVLWPVRESLRGSLLAWAAFFAGCGTVATLVFEMSIGRVALAFDLEVLGASALVSAIVGVIYGFFDWSRRQKQKEKKWVPAFYVVFLLLLGLGRAVPDHAAAIVALPWGTIFQWVWPVALALLVSMAVWTWQHHRRGSEE